jgi:N-hydroxyarylamine O-acetyltransferase
MDVAGYLARIRYRGGTAPSPDVLADLHLAHLLAVPFENLSIHAGETIQLRADWLFEKIVGRGRGGFCYELNGLFAELLTAIGFEVQRLAARVYSVGGALGIPFDHMCLQVRTGGTDWLADVGFGDSFIRPLRLDDASAQNDGRRVFRIEADGDERVVWDGAARSYRFGRPPYALADFEPGCRHHQTSADSHFTQRRVVSRLTATGRVTLRDDRLIVTDDGVKREQPVRDRDEWTRLAAERFDLR